MFEKYENKIYNEFIQYDIQNLDIKKTNIIKKDNIKDKINTNQKNNFETTIQPKNVLTKSNNNIYNNYSTKNLMPLLCITNSDNKNTINPCLVPRDAFWEEKFSCNYTALKSKDEENNPNSNMERVNLDQFVNSKYKKPQRTIKSYKKKFNIQKSDTIDKLSYKQIEYDSDINLSIKRPKIIYKKKEIDESLFPNKKNYLTESEIKQDEIKDKYQTNTLKSQSFFGSIKASKRVSKSTSKMKINQLNDFNIDKLIEIGDKYVNLKKPILPLGEKMNNDIIFCNNRIRGQIKENPTNSQNFNNFSYEIQNITDFGKVNTKDKDINNPNKINLMKDNKIIAKKIISKNNLKNKKTLKNERKKLSQDFDIIINKNNLNDETYNKNNRTLFELQKNNFIKITKEISYPNNFDKNNLNIRQNLAPNMIQYKKKNNLNLNQNHHNIENINIRKNNITPSEKRKIQNSNTVLFEQKVLNDDVNNYRNKVLNNKKKIIQNKELFVAENKKNNQNNNRPYSNIYYKDNQIKNYYRYDERHNLENTIDNNAYFESIYSKKKNNNNLLINKFI